MKKPLALWTRLFAPPALPRRRAKRRPTASASHRRTCGFDTLEPRLMLASVGTGWVGTQVDANNFTLDYYDGTAPATLVVPATYAGVPVTKLGVGGLAGQSQLTTVMIPASVTTISSGTFGNCRI